MNDSELTRRLESLRENYGGYSIEKRIEEGCKQAESAFKFQYTGGRDYNEEECHYDEMRTAYSLDKQILFRINDETLPCCFVKQGTLICYGKTYHESLRHVHFPDSVYLIMPHAFSGCRRLSSVHFGKGLLSIKYRAFKDCRLQSVILPDGLYEIGAEAFKGNSRLSLVVIPHSVRKIGKDAFLDCDPHITYIVPKGFSRKYNNMLPSYSRYEKICEYGYNSWGEADYYGETKTVVRGDGRRSTYSEYWEAMDGDYYYNNYIDNYSDKAILGAETGI